MDLPKIDMPEGVDADSFVQGVIEGIKSAHAVTETIWQERIRKERKHSNTRLTIHIVLAAVYSGITTFGCGYNVVDWQYWALLGCLIGIQVNLTW